MALSQKQPAACGHYSHSSKALCGGLIGVAARVLTSFWTPNKHEALEQRSQGTSGRKVILVYPKQQAMSAVG